MTSIRQQVFYWLNKYPDISLRETTNHFLDESYFTIRNNYYKWKELGKKREEIVNIDIRKELIKIIKDYKTPASARVQAIREYNNLIKEEPAKTGEDPYLKFIEKQSLRIATTEDIS